MGQRVEGPEVGTRGKSARASADAAGSRPEAWVPDAAAVASRIGAPPCVIRGANVHGAAVEVGIDWLRLRGPVGKLPEARRWLGAKFGEETEDLRGVHFFSKREQWASGAQVWYDEGDGESPYCIVEIPGGALATVDGDTRMAWAQELHALGFNHPTRIDLAIDWRRPAGGLDLVQAVEDACGRHELVGARRCKPVREFNAATGRVVGHTVYLGKRGGEGSGRFGRAYDKGLEMRTAGPGEWQRFEVEFTGDVSRMVWALLVQSEKLASGELELPLVASVDSVQAVAGWRSQALSIVLGSFDFKVATGQRACRRPRARWWIEVLGSVEPVRVRAVRKSRPCLAACRAFIRRCMAPTVVGCARATGQSPEEVVMLLLGDLSDVRPRMGPVVHQYRSKWREVA